MLKVDMDDFPIKEAMKIDIDDLGADSNDDGCFPKNPQSQEIPQYDEEDHDAFDHLGNDSFGRSREVMVLMRMITVRKMRLTLPMEMVVILMIDVSPKSRITKIPQSSARFKLSHSSPPTRI